MSRALPHYRDFRRFAAPAQVQQQVIPKTLPAPIRGLIQNENPAFMQPGAALNLDNWFATDATIKIRGGSQVWTRLGTVGTPDNTPIVSMFNYISGGTKKMWASTATKLYDVTAAAAFSPALTGFTITNGHFSTAQLSNATGEWLIAVNDAGDYPLRFDGTSWVQLTPSYTPPAGKPGRIVATAYPTYPVVDGSTLKQVWKYRRRLFFIQSGSMNAWYLDLDAVAGELNLIPLSGAFTMGGSLLFGCAWSVSAGDGIDDKCVFVTTEGEIAVFTGTNPGDAANWKQQGRYQISKPMGKNAWLRIGGDVLIITTDGIVPISQALVKDVGTLEFSAITRNIHQMWMQEVLTKNTRPWTMVKWDEFSQQGAMFVTFPGGSPGDYRCGVVNTVTGAWSRFMGWDALAFVVLNGVMFFGTQKGRIMQADIGGYDVQTSTSDVDEPKPYICSYVGGWEVFGAPPNLFTLRQGRVSFNSRAQEPFVPQLTAAVNYVWEPLPPPPEIGADPGILEVWDEGLWGGESAAIPIPPPNVQPPQAGRARWDQPAPTPPNTRTTYWVSIGETGWSHAPIVQVQINQLGKPFVEMLGVSLIAEQAGVAV